MVLSTTDKPSQSNGSDKSLFAFAVEVSSRVSFEASF